ncbi:hypothetical protein CPB86DRAFT_787734 [Serendipita vermifera]|nr:hypothetical protein CPB86DRAFT_787734 [Serendipita vermifera]
METDSLYPDLIGYGLGFSGKPAAIQLFQNPKNASPLGTRWKVTEIQRLEFPVAMAYADLTGNGYNDILITDRYGPNMDDLWDRETKDGGRVLWLRNPGVSDSNQPIWKFKKIGNATAMHRLVESPIVGHFTTKEHVQVLGIPVIAKSSDRASPAPVMLYTPKYDEDKSKGPVSWTEKNIFPDNFRLIHDVKVIKGHGDELDTVLVAGREGICYLYYESDEWKFNVVGTGLAQTNEKNPYWGSGSVDVGRVRDDPIGYIATCEAFHGNLVTVYVKRGADPMKGAKSLKDGSLWTRFILKDFGPLDIEAFTGTIHHVAAGDLDRSGIDSFAVACMGTPENQGVYVFKPIDLVNGEFLISKITDESAGRIALAAFTEPGVLEAASLSYYVPGYHTGPDPPSIRITRMDPWAGSLTDICATKLNKEVLIRVPRPDSVPGGIVPILPTLSFAAKRLSVVVLPPRIRMTLDPRDGVKVIYGKVEIEQGSETVVRCLAPAKHKTATTQIGGTSGVIIGGPEGAVFLHIQHLENEPQGPYTEMGQIKPVNEFPESAPSDVRALDFPFIKVEDLLWGKEARLWDKFEFYNMTGFHVHFNDYTMEPICHWQAWTLGIGETVNNHMDKAFCEIHACISNGGGEGGMWYFRDDHEDIDQDKELTKDYIHDNATRLICEDMHEHGPLWKTQEGSEAHPIMRPNGTVDYPWHAWLASKFGDYTFPFDPRLLPQSRNMTFEFPASSFQY